MENTSQMNDLETFASLCSRAETIGYKINKVVFRGFHSSDALQVKEDDVDVQTYSLILTIGLDCSTR